MSELKFIFTGTPGSGKTTAIGTISDEPPLTTNAYTSKDYTQTSAKNNAAMDFGEMTLSEGEKIHLYGTPGQERFRFMWDVIVRGGLGVIILIDHSRPSPLSDLDIYLDNFSSFIKETAAVIGITRIDLAEESAPALEAYYTHLLDRSVAIPVLPTDVRNQQDVIKLVDSLMTIIENK